MEALEVDLAVIGAGPAGQKGAIQGAKAGRRVVLVDQLGLLGGACLNQGTIPSKTLRRAILDMSNFLQAAYFGEGRRTLQDISMEALRTRIARVIEDENALLTSQCRKNGIATAFGTARFVDPHVLEVLDGGGQVTHHLRADRVLIATGSRPRHPIDLPDAGDLFVDSDLVFRLERLPRSLIVLGAGIIGCEYATMFAALGIEVVLMDRRDQLLRMLDHDVRRTFIESLRAMEGLQVRMGAPVEQLRRGEDGRAEVVLKGGASLRADCLFYSMGRVANVEGLGLERAGIALDAMGNIPVNALFQTAQPHIYAAGDVIGPPALASTSMEQGRLAVRNACLLASHHFPEFFPYGIYTVPEISAVGPTEEELRERGVHYEVGRAYYYEMARGPIAGDTRGLIKILFHAETLELLAVHIVGTNATELVPLGQMAINLRVKIDYFVDTIFNYPTFAEGYRIAALNGLNKLTGPEAASWS
ncbi:MAG: Si-specific NAD(P)(+) transhydrogenase [Gemmatimonadota bacterium]